MGVGGGVGVREASQHVAGAFSVTLLLAAASCCSTVYPNFLMAHTHILKDLLLIVCHKAHRHKAWNTVLMERLILYLQFADLITVDKFVKMRKVGMLDRRLHRGYQTTTDKPGYS